MDDIIHIGSNNTNTLCLNSSLYRQYINMRFLEEFGTDFEDRYKSLFLYNYDNAKTILALASREQARVMNDTVEAMIRKIEDKIQANEAKPTAGE